MAVIKKDGSLAAGLSLTPNNIWAGSAFELLPWAASISIAIVTPAAAGGLLTACYVGGALIAEEYVVPADNRGAAAGAGPIIPDDYLIQAGGAAGMRLVNTLRNPTGGALTYSAVAIIMPYGGGGGRRRR
jgi:hypothetical protein